MLLPKSTSVVNLTLQPNSEVDSKHKFLVLTAKCDELTAVSSTEDVKRAIEGVPKENTRQDKLGVSIGSKPQQQDLQKSVYEEAKSETMKSIISASRLSDMKLKRAQIEAFLRRKVEEKQELTRRLTKLKEEDATHIRKSQELARSRQKQGFTFIHIVLALLAGIVFGSLFLRSS
mmetsp:Transcript_3860/g.8133  ORF Transcript_3860/g.8133 Transcript_3860/m.8133 type:complete len:175 (-) Transcript_3860:118-642(-)